ncbi:MAG: phosphatase PAP2-related protein [Candidatus Accumulibacter sp. UW20]
MGNDFFFSGHTALAVYGAIHVITLGNDAPTWFAALPAVLQRALVIVLRTHWTLDVFAGLFAALRVGAGFWPR